MQEFKSFKIITIGWLVNILLGFCMRFTKASICNGLFSVQINLETTKIPISNINTPFGSICIQNLEYLIYGIILLTHVAILRAIKISQKKIIQLALLLIFTACLNALVSYYELPKQLQPIIRLFKAFKQILFFTPFPVLIAIMLNSKSISVSEHQKRS